MAKHLVQEVLEKTMEENVRLNRHAQKIATYFIMTNQKDLFIQWNNTYGQEFEDFFDVNYGKSSYEKWSKRFDKWMEEKMNQYIGEIFQVEGKHEYNSSQ